MLAAAGAWQNQFNKNDNSLGGTCTDRLGRVFANGESKICDDGCNTCVCSNGGLSTTLISCPPNQALCKHGDRILQGGETVLCDDGCNQCTCKNGEIVKTEKQCGKMILLQ